MYFNIKSSLLAMFFLKHSSFTILFLAISDSLVGGSGLAKPMTKKSKSEKKCSKKSSKKKNDGDIIYLSPGQSIQDALDGAGDGATIHLSPGDYTEEGNVLYGLRVSHNNVRLVGATCGEEAVATRILPSGEQQVGVYAAPDECEYQATECDSELFDFAIKGIVVEGFPKNGIQTRFVDGFQFIDSQSISNLNNGLYPTLSKNGSIEGCTSVGSLDAGLWVAGSRDIDVLHNDVSDSVTGIEITVSRDVRVSNNDVYDNCVGIGYYHANMAGTRPDFPPYSNVVFENNHVYDNNRRNDAPEGSFQSALPSGVGVLLVGVRGETVRDNRIEDNQFVGFGMAGFCTVQTLFFGVDCIVDPPIDGDPSANFNQIVDNTFSGNGDIGFPGPPPLEGADIIYIQSKDEFIPSGKSNENCFRDNVTPDGEPATYIATDFDPPGNLIPLPTGGCS